ncbi:MAG: phenylalanine--tRNA ligase subunit alpha [Acidobacteriota bacterium]
MEDKVNELRESFQTDLAAARDTTTIEAVRVRYLGQRSGQLTLLLKMLGELPRQDRPAAGKLLNQVKKELEEALAAAVARSSRSPARSTTAIDPTLPGVIPEIGTIHPITIVRRELEDIFRSMGYSVEEGPEVETDFHNFEALNFPPDHPARDEQDSFFAGPGRVLRTHTSPVQIRTMLARRPPLKFVAPGMAFRRDAIDPNHTPAFFQLEGMAVAPTVSMADLKGTLAFFWRRVFGEAVRVRFRPSFFPFVEPGAEVDISCIFCLGGGCRACGHGGWIEVGGAGMVHPEVFRAVGYDAGKWTGFAFGLGIDRITKLKYGIDDLRLFWDNDVRFLAQFRGQGLV